MKLALKPSMISFFKKYSVLAIVVVVSDRITKAWALTACVKPYVVNSWFSCSLAFNRGISWSLFHSELAFSFAMVTVLVLAVTAMVAWHAWQGLREKRNIRGEVLVLAGALSNVYDRFAYGGVVDFIALEYHGYCWPLFNIADIAVVVGVIVMVYQIIRHEARS
jgi:signal peptidase II